VPLYLQLTEILKERLEAGGYTSGDKFASERSLSEEFGVSRTVVRPALEILEADGQLIRIKGRGTFVAPPKKVQRVQGLTSALTTSLATGTELLVLQAERLKPEPLLQSILGLAAGRTSVAHIVTRASVDSMPMFLCDSYVSLEPISNILKMIRSGENLTASTAPLLALRLAVPQIRLETSFASEFESHQLKISRGTPVLLIRYIQYSEDAVIPIEFARMVYRSDIVQLDFG
jgi:GntR family transcriptional regulator